MSNLPLNKYSNALTKELFPDPFSPYKITIPFLLLKSIVCLSAIPLKYLTESESIIGAWGILFLFLAIKNTFN